MFVQKVSEPFMQKSLPTRRREGSRAGAGQVGSQDVNAPNADTKVDAGQSETVHELQCVLVTIRGASFMLNQIRKMIGLACAVVTGHAPQHLFDVVFAPVKVSYT